MQIFVTGGHGFIGSSFVKQVMARGDSVLCLARDPARAKDLAQLGAQVVTGDITDRKGLRGPMGGSDAVVHFAGLYKFGPKYLPQMRSINVDGTRNVLETAAELGVPKIVHVSTVGVFGNTRGQIVDESYKTTQEGLTSEYERTKWEAHYAVAVPLQAQGAPVIITQPGGVTGAGDPSPHMQVLDFYLNRFPLGFGKTSGVTWAHVDDVAQGHILALDRGKVGEAYILAGPCLTYKETEEMWAKLSGIPAPKLWAPDWMVKLNETMLGWAEGAGMHLPLNAEGISMMQNYTFWAKSDKAKRELGWKPRPLDETMREILDYEMKRRGKK